MAKTLGALSSTLDSLRKCTFYQPSLGYLWVFEEEFQKEAGPVELRQLAHRRKRRKVLDHRRPGERTPAEEEGIRATEGTFDVTKVFLGLLVALFPASHASHKTPYRVACIAFVHGQPWTKFWFDSVANRLSRGNLSDDPWEKAFRIQPTRENNLPRRVLLDSASAGDNRKLNSHFLKGVVQTVLYFVSAMLVLWQRE